MKSRPIFDHRKEVHATSAVGLSNRDDSGSAKGDVDGRYSSESYRQLSRA